MKNKNSVYLSLGSNLGDRIKNIKDALTLLALTASINKVSSYYESIPYGVTDQPEFINVAVLIETELSPQKLLETCKKIEKELGRTETFRWGPRLIDIDILLYNNDIINTQELIIPHADMLNRDFVITPLLEISPGIVFPGENLPIKELADPEKLQGKIRLYNKEK